MKEKIRNPQPTSGVFFVTDRTDLSLDKARRLLRQTYRLSGPETPVVSISGQTAMAGARRVEIVFKNTP